MRPSGKRMGLFLSWDWIDMILFLAGAFLITLRFIHPPPVICDEISRYVTVHEYNAWDLSRLSSFKNIVHDAWGFLLYVKYATAFLPEHEIFFRLPIFICSLAVLFVFIPLNRLFLRAPGRHAAMMLIVVSPFLLRHGVMLEPYAPDILISALLLFMFLRLFDSSLRSVRERVIYAVAGSAMMVTSLPAVFVIAGGCAVLFVVMIRRKDLRKMKRFLPLGILWAAVFTAYYFFNIRFYTSWEFLIEDWQSHMAPPLIRPGRVVIWLSERLGEMFVNPVGVVPRWGFILSVLGIVHLKRRAPEKGLLLLSPFMFMLAAVLLNKYPFHGRVLAFLLPMDVILIGAGIQFFREQYPARFWGRLLSVAAAVLVLFYPVTHVRGFYRYSARNVGMPPVLRGIKNDWQPGDIVYVAKAMQRDFNFFKERFSFRPGEYVLQRNRVARDDKETLRLLDRYNRVWFIVWPKAAEETGFLFYYADQHGERVDGYHGGWCRAYLYDWEDQSPVGNGERGTGRLNRPPG